MEVLSHFGSLKALRIFARLFHNRVIMESDSSNAVSWVTLNKAKPWKLQFCFNEIMTLASRLCVEFHHMVRSSSGLADSLAKQGLASLFLGYRTLNKWANIGMMGLIPRARSSRFQTLNMDLLCLVGQNSCLDPPKWTTSWAKIRPVLRPFRTLGLNICLYN